MLKKVLIVSIIFVSLFIIDQYIKILFVDGYEKEGSCISLVLAYNHGVAFSMFAFLQEYLKYIQLSIIGAGVVYLIKKKNIFQQYYIPIALLFAGGFSNIVDRFHYGAVVDYIYWHCGFDFAIFNFADMIIDLSIVIILWIQFKRPLHHE